MFANDRRLSADLDRYLTTQPEDEPRKKIRYIVAFYDVDRAYGGPEEGGWWYDTGALVRISRVFSNEDSAYTYCRRANDLLHFIRWRKRGRALPMARAAQRDRPSISHTNSEGRIHAEVHEDFAPQGYPNGRPHYE